MKSSGGSGLVILLGAIAVGFVIFTLIEERNQWRNKAVAEGQAHRATRSDLDEVRQQLQAKTVEVNRLKSDSSDVKKA